MIRVSTLLHDVSAIIQEFGLAVGLVTALIMDALAIRQTRRRLRRHYRRHRPCRSHG